MLPFNFQTGDAARVDAASAVAVVYILRCECGAVCVAGDKDMVLLFGPVVEPFFRFIFPRVVLGGAGGVKDTEMFQRFP